MSNDQVIKIVKNYAENLKSCGLTFDSVYLFGSYARGNPQKWSDIDVAIISPKLREASEKNRLLLWKSRRNIDLRIEPHGFTPEDWSNNFDPLVFEVRDTGIRVA